MTTPFGKAMRKLRIDRDMLLGDMADLFGMSVSYLSQIERGKKPIPDDLVDKAALRLKLSRDERIALRNDAIESTVEFRIRPAPADRNLTNSFVMHLARLTPEKKEQIDRVLRGGST